ncbi:hypothetical protein LCGC14_2462980 [marine sediment metagenome]|uniref:Uncharacterized protein n=1 Tax=marine sediment metagenome TaxID=412755 RepID=A0A0F9C0F6_9ZZZZ
MSELVDKYADIRPYNDDEVAASVARLIADNAFIDVLAKYNLPRFISSVPFLARFLVRRQLQKKWGGVNSVEQVQQEVAKYLALLVKRTTSEVTFSGLDLEDSDLDGLQIDLINDVWRWNADFSVECCYVEVTFEGDTTAELVIKNIDNGTSVSQDMGYITDGSYDISQVAVIGTDVYFNWKIANENVKLWKYDSIANTITEIKDCGTNTELPPDDMRGISYDEDNTLYFVLPHQEKQVM